MLRRIYDDYFKSSKIFEYDTILHFAKINDYEFHTVNSFANLTQNRRIVFKKNILILRCDVDTKDIFCLKQFLNIEKKYDARCSYYFRLNTCDYDIMQEIEQMGGEASYHYEEIATFAFKNRIKEKEIVLADLEHIRENFKINYLNMKAKSGLLMRTVASHGDYVNRKLKLTNIPIVSETVRTELGIIREAYDEEHMNYLTYRLADHNSRNFTQEAIDALSRRESVVELLIHPRQWKSDFIANTRENINRIYRGLLY
ncbi:hypothetical protein [uncultured Acetobacteroides sp.]|uniref:hypothetical protein n=1 Tax=uncultured Acetobacteroides sp. TaxID=1760811 RepID=UPI0029F529EB|nr:hypothetical protein [uncultured Acetobacteroides sp.]